MWKKLGEILSALVVLALVFGWGVYMGAKLPGESKILSVINKNVPPMVSEEVDFTPFWLAWNVIEQKYVDIEEVKRQDLLFGSISGLLKSLEDPYSVFLPPKDLEELEIEISGRFEGVGMEIGIRNDVLTVVAPLKGTPAERAGLKAGDKILEVDGDSTMDLTLDEAVRKIRGPKGSIVALIVLRNGEKETREIEVVRDVINIPVLDTDTGAKQASAAGDKQTGPAIPEDIFVIRLYNFSLNSTESFRGALREMLSGGYSKLILDLRNNPGGFLNAAVEISSWFLPQGEVVVEEAFRGGEKQTHRSRGYNIFSDLPMVILVNKGSASASEIVAGALRDHKVATLVGEKTFGKGSVQEVIPLTDDTSVKLTIAKWLTPNGVSISDEGLTPDTEVKTTSEDEEAGKDTAMEKAIEILSTQ